MYADLVTREAKNHVGNDPEAVPYRAVYYIAALSHPPDDDPL
jgi:hypothetical protein